MKIFPLSLIAILLLCAEPPARANQPQLWIAGMDPTTGQHTKTSAGSDFLDLFQAKAPWQHAASLVQVFYVSVKFINNEPNNIVRDVFSDLKRRGIALAINGMMVPGSAQCGSGIEGYSAPGQMGQVARRIRQLGGDLRYATMDEPLWFGHHMPGPKACHLAISTLASEIAQSVNAIHAVFPDAVIGDSEPAPVLGVPGWGDEIIQWANAYQAATGLKLGFFQADIDWANGWKKRLMPIAARLHAAEIPFGAFVIGNPDDTTNSAWVDRAERRMVELQSAPSLGLDQIVIASWHAYPSRWLPETQPGTMTYLIRRYAAAETTLTLSRSGQTLSGQLATLGGTAVAGKIITIKAIDNRQTGPLALHTLSATVPPHATQAIFGLRINTECQCQSDADVRLGTISFQGTHTGIIVRTLQIPKQFIAKGGRTVVNRTQKLGINSSPFPVTSDTPFRMGVLMHATDASSGSGYVTIIFLNAQHQGIGRLTLPLAPNLTTIGTVSTTVNGHFGFTLPAAYTGPGFDYLASFAGDFGDRMAETTIH